MLRPHRNLEELAIQTRAHAARGSLIQFVETGGTHVFANIKKSKPLQPQMNTDLHRSDSLNPESLKSEFFMICVSSVGICGCNAFRSVARRSRRVMSFRPLQHI